MRTVSNTENTGGIEGTSMCGTLISVHILSPSCSASSPVLAQKESCDSLAMPTTGIGKPTTTQNSF